MVREKAKEASFGKEDKNRLKGRENSTKACPRNADQWKRGDERSGKRLKLPSGGGGKAGDSTLGRRELTTDPAS